MSQPISIHEDAFDILAGRIIKTLCETINQFVQPRVQSQFATFPLGGYHVPKQQKDGLAAEMRRIAKEEYGAPEKAAKKVAVPVPAPATATPKEIFTPADIRDIIKNGNFRYGQVAEKLGITGDEVKAIVGAADSGLEIKQGGWVALATKAA